MLQEPIDNAAAAVDAAITSRRSVRAFRSDPVPHDTVADILKVARRAPSGTNMQPWHVHVLTGAAKQALTDAILTARDSGEDDQQRPYKYYPDPLFEPYIGRRRAVGWAMYGILDIKKGETDRMHAQHSRNFEFFDAPVGMIFSIDNRMEIGSWIDYGMFLQSIMIAARGRGLDTCPQAAFASYHLLIREHLGLPETETVICGMALGYADHDAPINSLETERADLADFVSFRE